MRLIEPSIADVMRMTDREFAAFRAEVAALREQLRREREDRPDGRAERFAAHNLIWWTAFKSALPKNRGTLCDLPRAS